MDGMTYSNVNDIQDVCPLCGITLTEFCRCYRSHSRCSNGHSSIIKSFTRRELKPDGRMHMVETYFQRVKE